MHDGASGTNRKDKHRQSVVGDRTVIVLDLEEVQLQIESDRIP
jgi:hypothetical protein